MTKLKYSISFALSLAFCFALFNQSSCFAAVKKQGLSDQLLDRFSANDIMFYDPSDCMQKGPTSNSCFKIDSSTSETDFWYPEGCLDNGDCTSGIYAQNLPLHMTSNNPFLLKDTMTDEEMGGMQYIYAENYDYDYDSSETKMTKNGGNSTRKYYWIVLPNEAYSNGLGDKYVATFEKLDEPIYFIVFDVHACEHQSEDYCGQASSDPDGVQIGKEFFGAFTKAGGSYTSFVNLAGKLTSICRIEGTGDVKAKQTATGSIDASAMTESSASSDYTNTSGDSKILAAVQDIIDLANANGSTYTYGGGHSGQQSTFDSMLNGNAPINVDCTGFASLVVYKAYGKMTSFSSETIFNDPLYKEIDRSEVRPGDIFAYNSPDGHGGIVIEVSNGKVTKIAETGGTGGRSGSNSNIGYSSSSDFSVKNMNGENGHFFRFAESTTSSDCNSFEGDYPQYFQGDYKNSDHENSDQDWTTIPYGKDEVSKSGCGPTSMAMLATVAAGKDIYPQDIINITKDTGSYTSSSPTELDPLVGEEYGFQVVAETYSDKNDAKTKIKDYLQKGYMIHMSGEGTHAGFSTSHTDGHYVGIFSINSEDNVQVANSGYGGNSQVPLQNLIDAIHNGVFTAIKGSGGGNSCFSYCGGGDDKVGDGGLTVEQAKTFMMNYGENKDDSSKNAVGALWDACNGGGSNCVTFSAFFMFKFTNITQNGRTGNGNEVVNVLKNRSDINVDTGHKPQVWAILSTPPQHTAVVLGHHDGKWIVGHASCSYSGKGRGNGGNGELNGEGDSKGGGSGFIAIEESDDPTEWQWVSAGVEFAYPTEVDVAKIEKYLVDGV